MSSALLSLLLLLPESFAGGVYRTALVASSNNGGPGRVTLRYADSDAASLGDLLGSLGAFSEVTRLPDATVSSLEAAMSAMSRRVAAAEARGDRTEVLLYYSGHSDETGLLLGGQKYGYTELRRTFDATPADVRVAVFDSCASGALLRAKGGTSRPAFLMDRSVDVTGSAWLTSSSAEEAAQESDRIGASYFTHALVTGLRGAADTSHDSRVSLTEAYQFAYGETLARTERTAAGAQHAGYDLALTGTGDLVLTDLNRTDAALIIDAGQAGRFYVRASTGVLLAELSKVAGKPVTLALGPGRYTILAEHTTADGRGVRLEETTVDLVSGQTVHLDGLGWRAASVEMARLRGGESAERHERFSLGIFPPLGGHEGVLVQHAALSLGANVADRLEGAQVALGANIVTADVRGAQLSVGANVAGGPVTGFQGSVGANWAEGVVGLGQWSVGGNVATGPVHGTQISVGTNVANGALAGFQGTVGANIALGVEGLGQWSVGTNISAGSVRGSQGTVGVNVVGGDLSGLQLSVGSNIVSGAVRGAQIGVGPQITEELHGLQLAMINIGGRVSGAQIGLVNIGGTVHGTQIGLVNIAEEMNGLPIGLVSIAGNGYNHVWVLADDLTPANLSLSYGANRVYNLVEIGVRPADVWGGAENDPALYKIGLGVGVHSPLGERLFLDVDASIFSMFDDGFRHRNNIPVRLRGLVGMELGEHLAVVAGPTMWGVPLGGAAGLTLLPVGTIGPVPAWFGGTAGVRF